MKGERHVMKGERQVMKGERLVMREERRACRDRGKRAGRKGVPRAVHLIRPQMRSAYSLGFRIGLLRHLLTVPRQLLLRLLQVGSLTID